MPFKPIIVNDGPLIDKTLVVETGANVNVLGDIEVKSMRVGMDATSQEGSIKVAGDLSARQVNARKTLEVGGHLKADVVKAETIILGLKGTMDVGEVWASRVQLKFSDGGDEGTGIKDLDYRQGRGMRVKPGP